MINSFLLEHYSLLEEKHLNKENDKATSTNKYYNKRQRMYEEYKRRDQRRCRWTCFLT